MEWKIKKKYWCYLQAQCEQKARVWVIECIWPVVHDPGAGQHGVTGRYTQTCGIIE
jgi:hypothetical protein